MLCFGWFVCNCNRVESYSDIPEIGFISLSFEDITTELGTERKAVLVFSFVDGDGDIGARSRYGSDTISKIHYKWYKKLSNDKYETFKFPNTGDTICSTFIPYDDGIMNKTNAHNKTLKGSIEIALSTPYKPQGVDTMHVKFWIFDRAGNKSNEDKTPDFSILNTSDVKP